MLLIAALLLCAAGKARRQADQSNCVLAHERAAADYSKMMRRTADREQEMFGEVLSFSVLEWLEANDGYAGRNRLAR